MTEQQINTLYSIIGARIREAREESNIGQDELATNVGVSRSSVVNIEKGRQRLPIHVLWNIANKLEVEPNTLLPDRNELLKQPATYKIDDETLKMIEQKSQGNLETRKKLIEFYLTAG